METTDIIQNIKKNLKNDANKQEGSFAADVLQATATEIGKYYCYANILSKNQFISTAQGEYLDKKGEEKGIDRKKATKAKGFVTVTGTEGLVVEKGSIFSSDAVSYQSTEAVSLTGGTSTIPIECTVEGVGGNASAGRINQTKLEGIQSVTNEESITNGSDLETDEAYRDRILQAIRSPATSGNKSHYRNWALEVEGVGKARVIPLHAGAGTVKVLILTSENEAADSLLTNKVKQYIAPDAEGEGKAPIGATLTVESGAAKTMNVSVAVNLNNESLETVKERIKRGIEGYFKKISFDDAISGVSVAKIADIIFNTSGVSDYQNLKLNNGTANVGLLVNEFPKLGVLEVTNG